MEEGLSIGHEAVVELTGPSRLLPHLVLEHLVGEFECPELVGGVVHEEALELADGPLVPAHEEDAQRETVGDEDDVHVAGGGGARRVEASDVDVGEQGFPEAGDAVVHVRHRLAVGKAVEEAAVAGRAVGGETRRRERRSELRLSARRWAEGGLGHSTSKP